MLGALGRSVFRLAETLPRSLGSAALTYRQASTSAPETHYGTVEDPQADQERVKQEAQKTIDAVNKQIQEKTHGRLFAVIHVAGKQFKITPDDIINIQGYWAPDIGDKIRLEKVLLAGSKSFSLLGRPLLPRDLVRIEGTVIEKTFSHTQLHYVHKRRKDYHRLRFHKTPYSMVRINSIQFDGLVDEVKDVEGLRANVLW